ncbi:hypothetical protein [Streptomyces solincola]|uniref:hypothetical protein n=1 Tax=Streptomyces solincola TaxID=2100817 RepID=UPI0011B27F48|nr:hypothetical protein [Streptomyces solincola]
MSRKFEGFANDAEYHTNPHYKRGCGVGVLLAGLSEADRTEVQAALDRPELSAVGIAQALKSRGVTGITAGIIGYHRRGACACGQ